MNWTDLVIALCGGMAIFCVSSRVARVRFMGCLFGVLAQPAWMYTAYTHEQWGILVLTLWYSFAWARGVRNNWRELWTN